MSSQMNYSNNGGEALGPLRVGLSLICPLIVVLISYNLRLNVEKKLLIGLVRTVLQLLFLSYVLLGFIYSLHNPFAVLGYLFTMITIAAVEVTNRQIRTYKGQYLDALCACLAGGGTMGLYAAIMVFQPSPWWDPHVVVPAAGMLIGNSVTGPSVAVDRLLSEVFDKTHEIEIRLTLGATSYESILPMIRAAIVTALTPSLNMMSIIGLVSIPGMMTGQLLGGAAPIVAAEYQMAILFLLCTTAAFSSCTAVGLTIYHAVFDSSHRLTLEKIELRKEGKITIDVALYRMCKKFFCGFYTFLGSCCTFKGNVGNNKSYELVPLETDTDNSEKISKLETGENSIYRADYKISENNEKNNRISTEVLLEISGLNVKSGDIPLFHSKGLTFSLHRGEILAIQGTSGLGKTRLLRAFSQLDIPLSGVLSLHGIKQKTERLETGFNSFFGFLKRFCVGSVGPKASVTMNGREADLSEWRRQVLYIPQALPPLGGTPKELLAEGSVYKSRRGIDGPKISEDVLNEACSVLEHWLRLSNGKLSQKWRDLSGGERQRAAIACGLFFAGAVKRLSIFVPNLPAVNSSNTLTDLASEVSEEENKEQDFKLKNVQTVESLEESSIVLLLDEPTAACDKVTATAVENALEASGAALILVSHDPEQAGRLAHKWLSLTPAGG